MGDGLGFADCGGVIEYERRKRDTKVNSQQIMGYHAHVYFTRDDMARTGLMREQLIQLMPPQTVVHGLIPREVGPHPLPMFEIDFPVSSKEAVLALVEQYRDGRSVLVHPLIQDQLVAHTSAAQWLGQKLVLFLDRL